MSELIPSPKSLLTFAVKLLIVLAILEVTNMTGLVTQPVAFIRGKLGI